MKLSCTEEYILSDEGQRIISENGTVNLYEGRKLVPLWQEKVKKMRVDVLDNLSTGKSHRAEAKQTDLSQSVQTEAESTSIDSESENAQDTDTELFQATVELGQGYSNIAKKLVKSQAAKQLDFPGNINQVSAELEKLFKMRTLWADDMIVIEKSDKRYSLKLIRDGVVLEKAIRD